MKRKFLLLGAAIGENYGCDAIVIGTDRIVQRGFHGSDVLLPKWSPRGNYQNVLGADSGITVKACWPSVPHLCRRFSERCGFVQPQVVRVPFSLVEEADCVLSIGGDLYTFADKETNWPFPYPIMEAGNEVIHHGKPYVIWCASVGPLEKAGKRFDEMVDHLGSCRAIIVREQESFSYLQDTVGLKDNVYLAADPAFVMEPEAFECRFLEEQGKTKLLAVNFSAAPIAHVCGQVQPKDMYAKLLACVQRLLDKLPVRLLFVPHVKGDYDMLAPLCEAVRQQYSGRASILPEGTGARKTKWAVSQANALLTMRFHCALAGFSSGTPTIVLVSTSKGKNICRDMYGNLEYALDIGDMNAELLVTKVRSLLNSEDAIRAKLMAMCETMKERAFSAGDVLAKVLRA